MYKTKNSYFTRRTSTRICKHFCYSANSTGYLLDTKATNDSFIGIKLILMNKTNNTKEKKNLEFF